ncbi:hypothetical protein ACL02T_16580 [Pseudonocardia sp. RS010]|uniref:hypothetical protein n=1 Tax=Pseudonocardia sp. RS010 TaxID=3385979 RepID=UPI0039A14FD2
MTLIRTAGLRQTLAFALLIGGTPVTFLCTPPLYLLFVVSLLLPPAVLEGLFPGWVLWVSLFNLVIGNGLMIYVLMMGAFKRRRYSLVLPTVARRRPENGCAPLGRPAGARGAARRARRVGGLRGFVSTGHAAFLTQAGQVAGGGPDPQGLEFAYPPLPTLLAGVLLGGGIALSVVAAVFAGVTLHLTGEQLLRRGLDLPTVLGLILPVFAVPAVAYAASQSVSGIAALSLLAVALQGFVVDGDTDVGFTCGLALAACFLFDPIAIIYALALGAAAFFFAVDRFRTTRSAAPATVAVITFPTVFVTPAWMFLQWRFTGDAADEPHARGDRARTSGAGLLR